MRICHVIEAAGGGSGQVVLDLARAQRAEGQEVTVIYAPQRAEARFVKELSSLSGIKIVTSSMRRKVGLHDLADLSRLILRLRRHGPFDILHSHSSKAGALTRLANPFLPRAVHVYTPHAFMTLAPGASCLYGWIEWVLSWLCDAIIATSEQEKRHGQEKLGIKESKLHVIPNGIRLDYPATREQARKTLGAAAADFVLGFAGRLVPQKNPARLVAAFAQAVSQNPDIRLAIIGDGSLRFEVERDLAQRGLSNRAHIFAGFNARDLVPGFDCLMCSSDYESFGLMLVEALAAGVPLVTTPVGIAEEAAVPGETGFVVDFAPEPLAKAALQLAAQNDVERRSMMEACRKKARQFSREAMSEKTSVLYNMLIQRKFRFADKLR